MTGTKINSYHFNAGINKIYKNDKYTEDKLKNSGSILGGSLGLIAGAAAGAWLGTMLGGPLGTAIAVYIGSKYGSQEGKVIGSESGSITGSAIDAIVNYLASETIWVPHRETFVYKTGDETTLIKAAPKFETQGNGMISNVRYDALTIQFDILVESGDFTVKMESKQEWEHSQETQDRDYLKSHLDYKE